VLLQREMEVASQYRVSGTPMGYLIDAEGRIAEEVAIGAAALLALAEPTRAAALQSSSHPPAMNGNGHHEHRGNRSLAESHIGRDGLRTGTPAPDFRLPRLDGGEVSLSEYRGRRVLLVFSSPECGPCDALAPQLEHLARRIPEVQILMVGRGDREANRAKAAQHGLSFPIVLQRQWEISRRYAMFATPIAYLIDEQGMIAAEVAVGVEPILSLLARAAVPSHGAGKRQGR
jgi:peroxiredoxin